MEKPLKNPVLASSPQTNLGRNEPPAFMFHALRTGVIEQLQSSEGLATKCVAAVAPVGYGKTMLMSILLSDLRHKGKQCFWLTLDDRDTNVDGIISELAGMLHSDETKLHPMHALFRGQVPSEKNMESLISNLNSHPLPITLFIDNLHFCTDPALSRLLNHLVFRTKPSVQIVLSSTKELPMDMSRAQLEGLVRQVGSTELSFGNKEITTLLGSGLCQKIGNGGIEELARKTEGWPAAIRMAQIILKNTKDPQQALATFSGSDESLAQLLNHQVFSGFPTEVRHFLLRLCQLRTFCVELCIEALGEDSVRAHLAYLVERNVFVIPLDRNRSWYRLHGLFRDYLLREAETDLATEERLDVLIRAAQWCKHHGYWREAVDYALSSGSLDTAVPMLEHIAPSFVRDRGASAQYIRWIEFIHEQGQQATEEAEYWFVWALAFHRRYDYAHQQITKLELRMASKQPGDVTAENVDLQRRIAILHASIDSLTDQIEDAFESAHLWLQSARDKNDDSFDLTVAQCIQANHFTNTLCFVEAHRAIQYARESAFQANSAYVDGWVSAYSGIIGIHEGNYAGTYQELVSSLTATRSALGEGSGICGTMALVAARCATGMTLDAEAKQLLEFGIETSRSHGFLEAAACGIEAILQLWTGTNDDPVSLSTLRNVAGAYPPRLSYMLSCFLIRRLIILGRIDEARSEAERIGIKGQAQGNKPFGKIALIDALTNAVNIDLLIASGRHKQAEALVSIELKRAKTSACNARLVELELDSASLAVRSHQLNLGVRHVTKAVRIAATRRILRPFSDHSDSLDILITESKDSAWGFISEEERSFFAEVCRKLRGKSQDRAIDLAEKQENPQLLDDLTARELELLGFIDAGLSNQQLADRIDISLTTVKWHLQNLYGKLGVSSRTAALAKARAMNLLTR
ncbi:MAG: LuxR C-terminal-related transcriptional regulator [Porticoccaceae bacterium]